MRPSSTALFRSRWSVRRSARPSVRRHADFLAVSTHVARIDRPAKRRSLPDHLRPRDARLDRRPRTDPAGGVLGRWVLAALDGHPLRPRSILAHGCQWTHLGELRLLVAGAGG